MKKKSILLVALLLILNACAGAKVKPEAQAQFEKGLILFDRGEYSKAVPHFKKSAELDPNLAKSHLYLGRSNLNMGQWKDAIPPLRAAYRLSPEESKKEVINVLVDAILGSALAKMKQGDFQGSVALFKEALDLNPESAIGKAEFAPAYLGLGGELLAKGEIGKAVSTYSEAMSLFPDNLKVYIDFAKALFKGGDISRAIEIIKEALKIDPSSWEARSLMLLLQGRQLLK